MLMPEHVIIDGNNLLFAMHAHAPIPAMGRETLVRVVERWARRGDSKVTIVFDGSVPPRGLAKQMDSTRVFVRYSGPKTADDVIIVLVQRARQPGLLRVVTSDTAIRHEAKYRRCRHTDSVAFVEEVFAAREGADPKTTPVDGAPDKPRTLSADEADEWLDMFDADDQPSPSDHDLVDGHDFMND